MLYRKYIDVSGHSRLPAVWVRTHMTVTDTGTLTDVHDVCFEHETPTQKSVDNTCKTKRRQKQQNKKTKKTIECESQRNFNNSLCECFQQQVNLFQYILENKKPDARDERQQIKRGDHNNNNKDNHND